MHELADGIEGRAQNAPRLLVVVCVGGSHDETSGARPAEVSVGDQAVAVDEDVGEHGRVGVVEEFHDGGAGDLVGDGDDDGGLAVRGMPGAGGEAAGTRGWRGWAGEGVAAAG